jgi:lysophospholipid acyltransferase (LPLAT)-like uncharacterized protein
MRIQHLLKTSLKKVSRLEKVQSALAWLGAQYIRLVFKTSRWERRGFHIPQKYLEDGRGFVTCFWHNRLLMACFGWPGIKEFHMLISSHSDGKVIAKVVAHEGIKTIAGSKGKGGMDALRKMIRILKQGHTVGVTPDGPRGPCYSVSEGTLTLARLAGVDILPFTYSSTPSKSLKSWDSFRVALPFSKGILMWGEPFRINPQDPIATQQMALRQHLLNHARTADSLLGIPS